MQPHRVYHICTTSSHTVSQLPRPLLSVVRRFNSEIPLRQPLQHAVLRHFLSHSFGTVRAPAFSQTLSFFVNSCFLLQVHCSSRTAAQPPPPPPPPASPNLPRPGATPKRPLRRRRPFVPPHGGAVERQHAEHGRRQRTDSRVLLPRRHVCQQQLPAPRHASKRRNGF